MFAWSIGNTWRAERVGRRQAGPILRFPEKGVMRKITPQIRRRAALDSRVSAAMHALSVVSSAGAFPLQEQRSVIAYTAGNKIKHDF